MKESKRKIWLNPVFLMLIQVLGIGICVWLKYLDITPLSDAMGLSGRWDFTADFIGLLFVIAPAVIAFVKKVRYWRYPVALACVPFVLLILGMGYFMINSQMNEHKAKLQRMAVYDSAEKIEKVIGIPFPEFKIKGYNERYIEGRYFNYYSSKAEVEFTEPPSDGFYKTIDSLCSSGNERWRKAEEVYLFDSLRGRSSNTHIVLSLLLTKGAREMYMEYDNLEKIGIRIINN